MPFSPHAEPHEVAAFIQRMLAEMRTLALESRLDLLAYLLDVAHQEAAQRAEAPALPPAALLDGVGPDPVRRSAR